MCFLTCLLYINIYIPYHILSRWLSTRLEWCSFSKQWPEFFEVSRVLVLEVVNGSTFEGGGYHFTRGFFGWPGSDLVNCFHNLCIRFWACETTWSFSIWAKEVHGENNEIWTRSYRMNTYGTCVARVLRFFLAIIFFTFDFFLVTSWRVKRDLICSLCTIIDLFTRLLIIT